MSHKTHLLLSTVLATGLSACAVPSSPSHDPAPVGMANPASVYCHSLGGKTEIRRANDGGEYGMCHLPDGTVIEEWELFRRDHPQR